MLKIVTEINMKKPLQMTAKESPSPLKKALKPKNPVCFIF